jgi:hypothetical protein
MARRSGNCSKRDSTSESAEACSPPACSSKTLSDRSSKFPTRPPYPGCPGRCAQIVAISRRKAVQGAPARGFLPGLTCTYADGEVRHCTRWRLRPGPFAGRGSNPLSDTDLPAGTQGPPRAGTRPVGKDRPLSALSCREMVDVHLLKSGSSHTCLAGAFSVLAEVHLRRDVRGRVTGRAGIRQSFRARRTHLTGCAQHRSIRRYD